jgi:hypothetical protein
MAAKTTHTRRSRYISRAGKKSGQSLLQDLRKARWYLDRWIQKLEKLEAGQ